MLDTVDLQLHRLKENHEVPITRTSAKRFPRSLSCNVKFATIASRSGHTPFWLKINNIAPLVTFSLAHSLYFLFEH